MEATAGEDQSNVPVVTERRKLALSKLATACELSGWRDKDPTRIDELVADFVGGKWGLTVTSDIRVLPRTDPDDNYIIDDGLSTACALKDKLLPFWISDPQNGARRQPVGREVGEGVQGGHRRDV